MLASTVCPEPVVQNELMMRVCVGIARLNDFLLALKQVDANGASMQHKALLVPEAHWLAGGVRAGCVLLTCVGSTGMFEAHHVCPLVGT